MKLGENILWPNLDTEKGAEYKRLPVITGGLETAQKDLANTLGKLDI